MIDLTRTEQSYLRNSAIIETRLYDAHGGVVAHRRFRAAVSQPRTRVQADDVRAQRGAARRPADAAPAAASHRRLRRALRARHHRQSSHPLRGRWAALSRDHRRVARGAAREPSRGARAGAALHHRPGRDAAGIAGGAGARIPRRHAHVLAGVGAHARGAGGLAGSGDPRRHHAQAVHLRGHRRGAGGADDLDPRGAAQHAQLGLSLLLAARQLFRHADAEPPGRDAHHGSLSALHRPHHRLVDGRHAAAAVRHHRRSARGGEDRDDACRVIAAWARCASAISPPNRCSTTCTAR